MKATCLTMSLLILSAASQARAVDVTLNVGDPAPKFTVKDDAGKDWNSAEHFQGKYVVVYFYPADLTGGCTRQACGFRDDAEKLKKAGVEVVGVSGDSVRNHQLFKKVHDLNFPLLADVEGEVATAFGVPLRKGEQSITREIDGKEEVLTRFVTPSRWTFLIGPDGKVAYKNEKVTAAEDSQQILAVVEKLKKQ